MDQLPITESLGQPLPRNDVHAISVSLPKWKNTLDWANRDPDTMARLQTGYPRFFIHRRLDELAAELLQWVMQRRSDVNEGPLATPEEGGERPTQLAMLFPHLKMASSCVEYICGMEQNESSREAILTFQVSFTGQIMLASSKDASAVPESFQWLYMVVYPQGLFKEAKSFWQHTGFGISSRQAVFWLENAPFLRGGKQSDMEKMSVLPLSAAKDAASAIRDRIAALLSSKSDPVPAEDVFLYPSGMSTIANSASALASMHNKSSSEPFRVAIFGFLYVDTVKALTKVKKFEYKLYGYASSSEMDQLERDLCDGLRIHALYTEFPGNPLLLSVDLHRLRGLSRRFGFHLVVDDTVGTSVNLNLAPFCDVLCTSLTKMFSGGCNVMGGSVTISPNCLDKEALRAALKSQHLDAFFPLDLLVMEANSRDFTQRMSVANQNARALADRLRGHPSVDEVLYPRGSPTQHLYERYKRARPESGYGYLFSIRFVKPAAAIAFHDALEVAKGPSLGTNFTLCCPYTLLAHATELEWAAGFGVVEHLVRLSVGIERRDHLEQALDVALRAAAEAC